MFPISILSLLFFFQSKICESTRNKSDGEASGHKMKKDFFLFLYYYQYRTVPTIGALVNGER
jgi:hypothetical protein